MRIKNAYIEIVNRCNLNCRDCYNSSGLNRETKELDPAVLLGFIKDLKERYQVTSVTISGGEPTLHSRFSEILTSMSELSSQGSGMDFYFITNGTTQHALFYELLERNPRFYVQFSLDGPDERTNASMRGPGNFEKVLRNAEHRHFSNPPIFKMVLNRTNVSAVKAYFDFVYHTLGGEPDFAFAVPQGNAMESWEDLHLSDAECTRTILDIEELYRRHGLNRLLPPMPTSHCDLTDEDPELGFCIKPDGSVQPCQQLYQPEFSLGNIYTLDWASVSEKLVCLQKMLRPRLSLDYGCDSCVIHNRCGRGCPALAYQSGGTLLSDDHQCELRKLSTLKLMIRSKNHSDC